jgi:hypothetical protein
MHKSSIKLLIILSLVLIISTCAGGASSITTKITPPPTSSIVTVLSNQATLPIMASASITCADCHAGVTELGDPIRIHWFNLTTCSTCLTRSLTQSATFHTDNTKQLLFARADVLSQKSVALIGGDIYCAACHGSPHAIYPTTTPRDNAQSIRLQGDAGSIVECELYHMEKSEGAFLQFGGDD